MNSFMGYAHAFALGYNAYPMDKKQVKDDKNQEYKMLLLRQRGF